MDGQGYQPLHNSEGDASRPHKDSQGLASAQDIPLFQIPSGTETAPIPAKGVYGDQGQDPYGDNVPLVRSNTANTGKSQRHRYRSWKYLIRAWKSEIAAVTISLISLGAIIIILALRDGNPLNTWSFVLSLNTVIAILGVISRTSLAYAIGSCLAQQKWNGLRRQDGKLINFEAFDQASRGPWGSFFLLYTVRSIHWSMLGPILVILFLSFDPFFQSAILLYGSLSTISESPNGHATIARSVAVDLGYSNNFYLNSEWTVQGTNLSVPGFVVESQPDFGLASAVYTGFYKSSASLAAGPVSKHSCATGNCTWPEFTSLAICSACNDVSSSIRVTTSVAPTTDALLGDFDERHESTQNGTDVPLDQWKRLANSYNVTTYELPYSHIKSFNGFRDVKMRFDTEVELYLTGDDKPVFTINSTADTDLTLTFKDHQTLLAAFLIMHASPKFANNKTAWEDATPTATECALSLCVNSYSAVAENGELSESVTNTWTRVDPDSWLPVGQDKGDGHNTRTLVRLDQKYCTKEQPYDDMSLGECINGTWENFPTGTKLMSLNPTRSDMGLLATTADSISPSDDRFNVSQHTVESTIQLFSRLTADESGLVTYPLGSLSNPGTPNIALGLFNLTDLGGAFDTMATSMTNYLRSISDVEERGSTQTWVIYVSFRWQFLTLPVLTVLAGTIYVICTVVETARLGLPAWTLSMLHTLAYGLDEKTQAALRAADIAEEDTKGSVKSINHFARNTTARLEHDELRPRLRTIS